MDYKQSFNDVRPSMNIRILVVDDQYTSLNIATTTLRSLNYEVLTAKHPFEALYTLRLMQGGIDLVISDYHMPDMNGVQLQKIIHEEFKIPVIMMSVDSREFVVVESLRGGSKVFLVKPIKVEKVENVWQYVVADNKGKSPSSVGVDRVGNYYLGFQDTRPVSFMQQEVEEGAGNNKNHKVIWTNSLHSLFLQAINQIGLDKAVPKKILDRMNVPGLTRQHVASHLQKYRNFLKNVAERGLVKCNDPQKALNEAFEMIMASNAEYHEMILSMPPSQFGRSSQPNLGWSTSSVVISSGRNIDECGATIGKANAALENSGSSYNNNIENGVRSNEHHQFPTRLGLNSNNHTTMDGGTRNEHLIPSRLGLSSLDHLDDSTKVALVFQNNNNNNNWINLVEPITSAHPYGSDPPSFNINFLNSTPTYQTSNHIEVTSYIQDELKTTPHHADMSEPTLGDDVFDSLSKVLLLPQRNGDIDMALDYAPHLLAEGPITTNQPGDQKLDDDFIGSFLVDDGPCMEADERSC